MADVRPRCNRPEHRPVTVASTSVDGRSTPGCRRCGRRPRSPRVIALLIVVAATMFLLPAMLGAFWLQIAFQPSPTRRSRSGSGSSSAGPACSRCAQIPVVAVGVWFALRLQQQCRPAVPDPVDRHRLADRRRRRRHRLPRAAPPRALSGVDHVDGRGRDHAVAADVQVPQRRRAASGASTRAARPARPLLDRPSHRRGRHRLLPLLRGRRRDPVPDRHLAHHGQARTGVGGDPPEPGHRGRGRRRHDALQAVGFFLSACITGVAGALLAAGPGGVTVTQFPVEESIILLAVVLMGGVYNIWGAVVAAFFLRVLPRILDQKLGLPPEFLTMLFGVGVMQVLIDRAGRRGRGSRQARQAASGARLGRASVSLARHRRRPRRRHDRDQRTSPCGSAASCRSTT